MRPRQSLDFKVSPTGKGVRRPSFPPRRPSASFVRRRSPARRSGSALSAVMFSSWRRSSASRCCCMAALCCCPRSSLAGPSRPYADGRDGGRERVDGSDGEVSDLEGGHERPFRRRETRSADRQGRRLRQGGNGAVAFIARPRGGSRGGAQDDPQAAKRLNSRRGSVERERRPVERGGPVEPPGFGHGWKARGNPETQRKIRVGPHRDWRRNGQVTPRPNAYRHDVPLVGAHGRAHVGFSGYHWLRAYGKLLDYALLQRGRPGQARKALYSSPRWNVWMWTRRFGSFGTRSISCFTPRGRRTRHPF